VTARPDPWTEIRLVSLRALRGASFWSRRPLARMDLTVGAYDEIHSAEVPGLTEALVEALPGLEEHRCSIGERGGFVTRLRRGTYAPHIAEHVALELQAMIGHPVGFGRARGGDRPGEYLVVLEHRHAGVGMRAAELGLEVVRRAFAGTLSGVGAEVRALRAAAAGPDLPPLDARVTCAVTGGGRLGALVEAMRARGVEGEVVERAPAVLLEEGLAWSHSDAAVVLDATVPGVPARYTEPDLAARLLSVIADGVPEGGPVVLPAAAEALGAMVEAAGRRAVRFAGGEREAADAVAEALALTRHAAEGR
jgi:cyanophycin synthetase